MDEKNIKDFLVIGFKFIQAVIDVIKVVGFCGRAVFIVYAYNYLIIFLSNSLCNFESFSIVGINADKYPVI